MTCSLKRPLMDIKAAFPHVIGFDGAGTVTAVGEDVTGLAADDRVYAAAT
ncbi:hypothetical protein BH23ACT8_BH23ACT8_09830 [soil metagenome]